MATDNRQVAVYLPKEVEEILTKYCLNNAVTRKDKNGIVTPALGTGIVQILSLFFKLENTSKDSHNTNDTVAIERIIETYLESKLPSMVASLLPPQTIDITQIESNIESTIPSVIPPDTTDITEVESIVKSNEPLPSAIPPDTTDSTDIEMDRSYDAAIAMAKKMLSEGKPKAYIENYLTENKYCSETGRPKKWKSYLSKVPELKDC
jgi:hypothetical protein